MVSSIKGSAPVQIHQDVNVYSLALDNGLETTFEIDESRQAYLVQIEGNSVLTGSATKGDIQLLEKDSVEIVAERFSLKAEQNSHYILIEMEKA